MSNTKDFSEVEKNRYNDMSSKVLSNIDETYLKKIGSHNFKDYYKEPYLEYEKYIGENVNKNHKVLELCCGNGIHSFTISKTGADLKSFDYSKASIEIAKKRHKLLNGNIVFNVADVNELNLSNKFDYIVCIGSLSYIDNDILIENLKKWLKPKGRFILIDSLNHNIFYRLNRFIRYLRKQRSWRLNLNIPSNKTLKKFSNNFNVLRVDFYGVFLFLTPLLNFFFDEYTISKIIKLIDFKILRIYAFKIFCVYENKVN